METLAYLDSSVLLSLIFNDTKFVEASEIFSSYRWASSKLLAFECANVLIRESHTQSNPDLILKKSLAYLNKLLDYVNIIPINNLILNKVLSDKRISKGRTLDSIHLASALVIKENHDGIFSLATFDNRLAELATELGLSLV